MCAFVARRLPTKKSIGSERSTFLLRCGLLIHENYHTTEKNGKEQENRTAQEKTDTTKIKLGAGKRERNLTEKRRKNRV
jgi:hypothetical protein